MFWNVFLYVQYSFSQFSHSDAFLSFRDVFLCPFSLLCFPLYWHCSVYLFSYVEVTMTLQSWLTGSPMKQTISHSKGIFFPLIIILPKYVFNWTSYVQLEEIIVCYNLLRYIKKFICILCHLFYGIFDPCFSFRGVSVIAIVVLLLFALSVSWFYVIFHWFLFPLI